MLSMSFRSSWLIGLEQKRALLWQTKLCTSMPNKPFTFTVSVPRKHAELINFLEKLGETGQRSAYIVEALLASTKGLSGGVDGQNPCMVELERIKNLCVAEFEYIKSLLENGSFVSEKNITEVPDDIWAIIQNNL